MFGYSKHRFRFHCAREMIKHHEHDYHIENNKMSTESVLTCLRNLAETSVYINKKEND